MPHSSNERPAVRSKDAPTAADLMTANPVSLLDTASVEEATAFLVDTGYSAAPVIDAAGRPVGVVSRTDIVVHDRELHSGARVVHVVPPTGKGDATRVRDLMTPAVFAVGPETPVEQVARQMAEMNVHRLFVVDGTGTLIGIVSALDLLRHYCP